MKRLGLEQLIALGFGLVVLAAAIAGAVSIRGELEAGQRSEAAAEQNLAQLEATLSTDQINVFLALGGGWETETGTAGK